MKLLFLDTETTGNEPGKDRLVSVAYKTAQGEMVHELFKPPIPMSIDAISTHHITEAMVANKISFAESERKKELEKLLVDHILVAHNAPFDIAMLEAEEMTVPQFICTIKVARALDEQGETPRFGLQYLRYYFNLNVENVIPHSADGDVLVLEAIFNYLLKTLREARGLNDEAAVQEMMLMTTQPSLLHRLPFGKYRGERLDDIAKKDADYLRWLLSQKEAARSQGEGRMDDADMIYSLQYYLYPAGTTARKNG